MATDLEKLFARADIARDLHQIPTACPAALHDWVQNGYTLFVDEDGSSWGEPEPDVASGARCAMEATVHKHGCCWCGKFRTAGRELTDGRP